MNFIIIILVLMFVVCGEILLDIYGEYKKIGGAPFNFAYHINAFGKPVVFISRIGKDPDARVILDFLALRNFNSENIQIDDKKATGNVIVSLKDGIPDYTITRDVAYDYIEYDKINIGPEVSLLYIGTLAQRSSISRNSIHELAEQHKSAKCFYDVNLRKDNFDMRIVKDSLLLADIVKINDEELRVLAESFNINGDESSSMSGLSDKFAIESVCVTKGAEGSVLLCNGIFYEKSSPDSPDVIDTVGAGDAYSSVLALGIINGWGPALTADRASEFAMDICGINGAVPDDLFFYDKYKGWFL
ncbi:MAG: hypothetical protein JXA66_00345 [Oligoflexia bacterium]|nr:hypothetical protein [Oligoflexia bacterium]